MVVEDDPGLQSQLRWCFDGFDVTIAGDRTAALDKLQKVKPQVVTLDLGLPPDADGHTEGLACLEQILSTSPDTKVIVVTGNDDRANAVRAIGLGAFDFYHKPIDAEILGLHCPHKGDLRPGSGNNRLTQRLISERANCDGSVIAKNVV